MTSLWLDRPLEAVEDEFPEDDAFQDVVVGAGITGLATALLLARAGRRVGVLEARHHGAVTTGRASAKVSLLQGTRLSRLLGPQPRERIAAYVEANREGLEWLGRFCADHNVPTQTRPAVTYAAEKKERKAVRREYDAARSLGLGVRWVDGLDAPFPDAGAVVLDDQRQLDPMDLLGALVREIRAHGGTLHERQRVQSASRTGVPTLHLETGRQVTADRVVLATGVPILDRAVTFAKVEPQRSYLLAYRGAQAPPAMYLSAGAANRSLRDLPSGGFLVGGAGHAVGRTSSEQERVEELRGWAGEHFPGAVETHAWSAQDYTPYGGLPLVGRLPFGGGQVFYATGYDAWGMTNAVAAALRIAAEILGGTVPEWAEPLDHSTARVRAALRMGLFNTRVGLAEAQATVVAQLKSAPAEVAEGTGVVGRSGVVPEGVSQVDGRTCRVTALCSHLGGTLRWNDLERSWDCPLHGSRFAPDGQVLEGPATRALQRRDSGEPGPLPEA